MKNLDIEIYMKNFKGFFEKNPSQLKKLIGNTDPDKFYQGIRNILEINAIDESKPIEPTRKQIIDLILGMSSPKKTPSFYSHHMGNICMN